MINRWVSVIKAKNDAQMMLYELKLLDFLQKVGQVENGRRTWSRLPARSVLLNICGV